MGGARFSSAGQGGQAGVWGSLGRGCGQGRVQDFHFAGAVALGISVVTNLSTSVFRYYTVFWFAFNIPTYSSAQRAGLTTHPRYRHDHQLGI
jgi:hypothetical protein